MKQTIKFTDEQIKAMYNYLHGLDDSKVKEDLQFLYNPHTPQDIYIKYITYGVSGDNSITSNLEVLCVKPDGATVDCFEQFENLAQKMQFSSNFIEIDLDNKGNLRIK